MMKTLEEREQSFHAIKAYCNRLHLGNKEHKANVRIFRNDEIVYENDMDIFASIESNYSFVRIIGDKNYSNVFYQEYRNTYQDFYYNDGILEIKATDKKENEIEIFIEY